MTDRSGATLAFARHDHARCQSQGLEVARRSCAERGLRLTQTRERVLRILLETHEAIGAYEVLKRLTEAGSAPPQPPIAYRALDFLVANGFAHRIEKLNAYVACVRAEGPHPAAFMICSGCGHVAEIDGAAVVRALGGVALDIGFELQNATVEASGLCVACRPAAP
jgi:Fur family zinc uptake transcriptional regulator